MQKKNFIKQILIMFSLILSIAIIQPVTLFAAGNNSVKTIIAETNNSNVLVNDNVYQFYSGGKPERIDGNLYIPVRFIAENMGLTVDWDGGLEAATISNPVNGNSVFILKDYTTMYIRDADGDTVGTITLPFSPKSINGSICVPIEVFYLGFGYQFSIGTESNREFILVSNHIPAWTDTEINNMFISALNKL